jgi:ferredoxin
VHLPASPKLAMTIRKVWIAEGCIACNLCQDLVPEVFEVPPGSTSRTRKGHEKLLDGSASMEERIQEAVDSCPVEVIHAERR